MSIHRRFQFMECCAFVVAVLCGSLSIADTLLSIADTLLYSNCEPTSMPVTTCDDVCDMGDYDRCEGTLPKLDDDNTGFN